MEHGELRFMPYSRLFERVREVEFEDGSRWDAYPNRDSLSYREVYALKDVKDMVRGTLRYQGYCDAWHIFVLMGITDDSYQFPLQKGHTYKDFASSYLPGSGDDFRKRIKLLRPGGFSDEAIEKVLWTGLFDAHPIGISEGSPAMILQHLLEARWKLQPADKDLVLMQHLIEYEHDGAKKQLICSLRVSGTDAKHTAMAKTVGLPLAITCRLFLENKLKQRGVLMPIDKEVYLPVLAELEANGISFSEVSRNL
jgi:saccharopine dehydrogenase (NADP+, L-glutamate forming)